MRYYPKGCRYHIVVDGEAHPLLKTKQPTRVETIAPARSAHLVIQPRSSTKWHLFRCSWKDGEKDVRRVATQSTKHALLAAACMKV